MHLSAESVLIDVAFFIRITSNGVKKYIATRTPNNVVQLKNNRYCHGKSMDERTYLGHIDDLIAWQIQRLDCLAQDYFRETVRVSLWLIFSIYAPSCKYATHISRIERVDACIIPEN